MQTILFLIPAAFLLALNLYFFQLIRTVTQSLTVPWQQLIHVTYWGVSFILIVLLWLATDRTFFPLYLRYYIFSICLLIVVPQLIGCTVLLVEDIERAGTYVYRTIAGTPQEHLPGRRTFVSQAGLLLASVPFAGLLYGMVRTGFAVQVTEHELSFEELPPSFDGLKVVQISDLHTGSFASSSYFEEVVSRINSLDPDLILFTGDLVNNMAKEAEPFIEVFGRLQAALGVYSILGNHDYGDYIAWETKEAKQANFDRLKEVHRAMNWTLLTNEHVQLQRNGETLVLAGVENWSASRHFPKYGDLEKALRGAPETAFTVLMSHDPTHWDAKVVHHRNRVQLTLSGHTHGAQFGIEIPGFRWSPAQYIYRQWAGLYEHESGHKLYVNRGLGFIGYMGRVGIAPEITLLRLRSDNFA